MKSLLLHDSTYILCLNAVEKILLHSFIYYLIALVLEHIEIKNFKSTFIYFLIWRPSSSLDGVLGLLTIIFP
uniref:Uncharacterized protein n=1 Tax=Arundo donax TaxID=35708 RepID=A0A0A9B5P9_ARUDO